MGKKLTLISLFVLLLSASLVISDDAPAATKGAAGGEKAADGKTDGKAGDGGAPATAPSGGAPDGAPAGAPAAGGGAPGSPIDITTLGAKAGADASEAMTKAWTQACAATSASKIVVPKGNFSLGPIEFKGPCKAPITIEMSGNFEAPKTVAAFNKKDTWVKLESVVGVAIVAKEGGGVFNGNGEDGWKNNKCAKTGTCSELPYNFRLNNVNDSAFDGITSKDSKQFHMNLIGVFNFTIQNAKVIAPGDAPNTDGIHIGRSQNIKILDTDIGTGDDCISVGDGTKNLTIKKVTCGPGHGLSVGSLGRYDKEEPVVGVYATDCTFKNTDNGVRIKSWLNSKPCEASDLHFEGLTMDNVTFPILIDQAYCPAAHCDASVPSKVKISKVSFKNVKGTAADPSVMRFVCSKSIPCADVHVEDIDLKYEGKMGKAVSECCNVKPESAGTVNPAVCSVETTEAEAADHITAGTKFLKNGGVAGAPAAAGGPAAAGAPAAAGGAASKDAAPAKAASKDAAPAKAG